MSYNSRVYYLATAGQQEFDLPFPFIHRDHVTVRVNGAISTKVWISPSRIRLPHACVASDAVTILRDTPIADPIVQFQNGSVLTEEELNTAVEQLLYKAQEVEDLYNYSLNQGMVRLGDRLNVPSTPGDIIDEFVTMVLENELLDEFRQRISDIDLNAEQIIGQALQITNAQDVIDQQWAAQANAAAVVSTLQSSFDSLVGVVDGLVNIGDGEGIATLIANEANARVIGDTAIATTLALIGAANGPGTAFNLNLNTVMANSTTTMAQRLNAISAQADANSRTIFAEEITATSNAISAQGSILSGLTANVAGNRADIINESNVRSNAIAAIAGTIALLGANAVSGAAFILDQNKVMVTPSETIGQRLTTISANSAGLAAAISSEQTARITNATALATQISGVGARVDGANAAILTEQTARVSADNAEANARTALAATISGQLTSANAAIAAESSARATANAAQTAAREAAVSQLQTGLNSANAAIVTEATTRADANAAQTAARTAMAATFTDGLNSANAAIVTEASTRATADTALTNTFTLLGAANGPGTAFILNDATVRVNATTTLGTFMSGVDSRFGDASASVVSLTSALATANAVAASAASTLTASINGANAAIISEATTRASADTALTNTFSLLGAINGPGTAFVFNESTVLVNATTSLGTFMSGVNSRFGTNEASVSNLSSALATANSVSASAVSGLSASINGANASITSLSTIVSGTGGLTSRAGVIIDNDGLISGWTLNNDGDSGSFEVLSENFSITSMSSGARTEYRNGIWYVYDTDSATRSMNGKMFGGSEKLVLWVGPNSVAEGSETKANAYVYVSAVTPRFGGSDVNQGGGASGGVPLVSGTASCSIAGTGWQHCKTFTITGVPISPMISFNWEVSATTGSGEESAQFRLRESGTGGGTIGETGYFAFGETISPAESANFYGAGQLNGTVTYILEGRCAGGGSISGSGPADFSAFQILP